MFMVWLNLEKGGTWIIPTTMVTHFAGICMPFLGHWRHRTQRTQMGNMSSSNLEYFRMRTLLYEIGINTILIYSPLRSSTPCSLTKFAITTIAVCILGSNA